MSDKNNKLFILKLAVILFAITFIATLALTVCNYLTKNKIAELEAQSADEAKQAVIADASFTEIKIDSATADKLKDLNMTAIFKAEKDGEFAGYCVNVEPNGFGGAINMIVGIAPDLESYTGIKIISMSETPGLGAKAQDESFSSQYADGKKGVLSVVKNTSEPKENEINAISGATITSDAVTKGANDALKAAKIINEKEAE